MSVTENDSPGRGSGRGSGRGGLTAGIDWASEDHAVSIVDLTGVERERFTVEHTAAGLRRLVGRLRRCGVVEVGIERPDGPVVDALLAAGLVVLVIPPNQVRNLRGRYGSAGKQGRPVRCVRARRHRAHRPGPVAAADRGFGGDGDAADDGAGP